MDQIEEFTDERQKSWCIHCGSWIGGCETNRDHVPSKSLLRKPYPANLPVVEVCSDCNVGFSLDEEYVAALLACVITGSTTPDAREYPAAARILQRNAALRARIAAAKTEHTTLGGETKFVWKAELD